MNLEALKTWREENYDGLSDADFLTAANAPTVVRPILVSTAEITNFLMISGLYGKLLTAYHNAELPQDVRNVAETAIDLSQSQIPHIDLTGEGLQAMLAALVACEALTQEEADSITALGTEMITPAQAEFGVAEITQADLNCVACLPKLATATARMQIWQGIVDDLSHGVDRDLEDGN